MASECQVTKNLERALLETLFAIAAYDDMRAQASARDKNIPRDPMGGVLLLLRSALDAALSLDWRLALVRRGDGYGLAEPDSNR